MKKLSIIILLTVAVTSCQDFAEVTYDTTEENSASTRAAGSDGQDYYWYRGEKIYLTRNNDFVNVVADGKLKKSSKSEVARSSLNATKETAKYVMPFFERGEGIEPIGTSDIFYLKLKAAEDVEMLKKMATELGVQVIEEIPYTPLWYTLSIIGSDFSSSIEASNFFYETGNFEDVDPAFMFDFKPSADDSEFWRQWGMVSTSSHDINVVPAWNITRGAGIKVAVVDTPIQSNHTDLDGNIHSLSYNAQLKRTPSAPYDPNYYPYYHIGTANHGTRVAGIIAAEKNGDMVTGVAYESKIVRVSHDSYFSSTMASELASGINWAWKATNDGGAGVDVINCSWGDRDGNHNVHPELHSTILEEAIDDAMTQGRGGKGCVVVFAAGNSGQLGAIVNYPGNFHPNILVVGSIDESGNRSYFSGYGSQLDVMAPGGSIWSTIYNNTTGYDSGTSFAAPHVAGIAALILSKYPDFTRQQVVDIIQSTANRYPSRNNEYGYGLVDAHKALFGNLAIYRDPHESGYGDHSNIVYTYRVTNPPTGVSFSNWSITPNYYTVTGGTNIHNLTIKFTKAIDYTLTANFTLPNGSTYSA